MNQLIVIYLAGIVFTWLLLSWAVAYSARKSGVRVETAWRAQSAWKCFLLCVLWPVIVPAIFLQLAVSIVVERLVK